MPSKQFSLFNNESASEKIYLKDDLIILSLQPKAYEQIKTGKKQLEYRTRFRKGHSVAIIYVSGAVKEIKGFMIMGKPIIDTPEKIAGVAEKHIAGNGSSVYDYLKGYKLGYAIPIEKYVDLTPIPLSELRSSYNFVAPQSYCRVGVFPKLEEHIINAIKVIDPDIKFV